MMIMAMVTQRCRRRSRRNKLILCKVGQTLHSLLVVESFHIGIVVLALLLQFVLGLNGLRGRLCDELLFLLNRIIIVIRTFRGDTLLRLIRVVFVLQRSVCKRGDLFNANEMGFIE